MDQCPGSLSPPLLLLLLLTTTDQQLPSQEEGLTHPPGDAAATVATAAAYLCALLFSAHSFHQVCSPVQSPAPATSYLCH